MKGGGHWLRRLNSLKPAMQGMQGFFIALDIVAINPGARQLLPPQHVGIQCRRDSEFCQPKRSHGSFYAPELGTTGPRRADAPGVTLFGGSFAPASDAGPVAPASPAPCC